MPDEMNNAGLNKRLWECSVDGLRKALQTINDGDQNILDTSVLQFVHHPQPEFGSFACLDPNTKNIFRSISLHAKCQIDRLVADEPFIPDLHPHRVKENQWIARL